MPCNQPPHILPPCLPSPWWIALSNCELKYFFLKLLFDWSLWLAPAWSGKPHSFSSPPPKFRPLRVSEKKGKTSKSPVPLHSWQLLQLLHLPLLMAASHPSPHLSAQLSFWSYLSTNPGCSRHIVTPCLQSIKSLCLSLGARTHWPPLRSVNPSEVALLNISVLILFPFGLIWLTASLEKLMGEDRKSISYLCLIFCHSNDISN